MYASSGCYQTLNGKTTRPSFVRRYLYLGFTLQATTKAELPVWLFLDTFGDPEPFQVNPTQYGLVLQSSHTFSTVAACQDLCVQWVDVYCV